ncbi:hypothetical protein OG320_30935 [Microbispora sp. NBC_01189]|uniref:hypothetical protein n=1 Tax=Microbispora sp. NBC_01189 TaxID=2903583 RepID=UPI002E13EC9C|nr:hypothetical protein OG320_30935 [Microbispora sp. NBC_01189]
MAGTGIGTFNDRLRDSVSQSRCRPTPRAASCLRGPARTVAVFTEASGNAA